MPIYRPNAESKLSCVQSTIKNISTPLTRQQRADFYKAMLKDPQSFLKGRNIDPSKLHFHFTHSPENLTETSTVSSMDKEFELVVEYSEKPILQMKFNTSPDYLPDEVKTFTHPIEDDQKGKGIASIAYLTSARHLHQKHGLRLCSDWADHGGIMHVSKNALPIWERFSDIGAVRFGHREIDQKYYFNFRSDFLNSDELNAFDSFKISDSPKKGSK